MPNFTKSTEVGTFSFSQSMIVLGIIVFLYAAFLVVQTIKHKEYFIFTSDSNEEDHHGTPQSLPYHVIFLVLHMLVIVLLSKKLAIIADYSMDALSAPAALGGLLVAILVLSPEGMAALQAARSNNIQRFFNLTLGSAIATIGLTIPAVLIIGVIKGNKIILGLDSTDTFLLVLTFLVSIVNFSSGKSNMMQGLLHMALFVLYLVLVFD